MIAHDAACNAAVDSSDGAFTISTTPTAVGAPGAIASFALGAIRPNPSHGAVQIEYLLPREANVRLSVVDVQGREVALLAHGRLTAGRYTAAWTGGTTAGEVPRGTYFARFEANGRSYSKRFVVLR